MKIEIGTFTTRQGHKAQVKYEKNNRYFGTVFANKEYKASWNKEGFEISSSKISIFDIVKE